MHQKDILSSKRIQISYKVFYLCGLALITVSVVLLALFLYNNKKASHIENSNFWKFEAIDTMKYSRDLAREKLNHPLFNLVIDQQVRDIAATGATHIAIATPYDDEFYPMLKRWVESARKYRLKIWFRGNFSGWEGWFEYSKITRAEHMELTEKFLEEHPEIFENGDVFTACPECENGGPGNPTRIGDVEGHRKFLIAEYQVTKKGFLKMGKTVASNYDSMNKDVAVAVMDKETTAALDGIVTIDHYVSTPEKLAKDIDDLAEKSGGKIVLGEFGVPIPDINGEMTETQQADWVRRAGQLIVNSKNLVGLSYWVNLGGSTKLWNDDNTKRKVVDSISSFYNPKQLLVIVDDEAGQPIEGARVLGKERFELTRKDGKAMLPYLDENQEVTISADNYKDSTYKLSHLIESRQVILERNYESSIFKLKKFFKRVFPFL